MFPWKTSVWAFSLFNCLVNYLNWSHKTGLPECDYDIIAPFFKQREIDVDVFSFKY